MGAYESKPGEERLSMRRNASRTSMKSTTSEENLAYNSLERSSTKRKLKQIEAISQRVQLLKNEIYKFSGARDDPRYTQYQQVLAKYSRDLQDAKKIVKKKETCDQILGEIKICFQNLEDRVTSYQTRDSNLDLAAVESRSFISPGFEQTPPPKPLPKTATSSKYNPIDSLDLLEYQAQNLEREVKLAVELKDTKQFIVLEKKIQILYTDLEMLQLEEGSPLHDKKENLGKLLIKNNNMIRKTKRLLAKRLSENPQAQDKTIDAKSTNASNKEVRESMYVDPSEEISQTEAELEILEIGALTFDGMKDDSNYRELEQKLESRWTKMYGIEVFTNEDVARRSKVIDKTKKILQELRARAEQNEQQKRSLEELQEIQKGIESLADQVSEFTGVKTDVFYTSLDQSLRNLWAKISGVEEPNEHVRRNKNRHIYAIQQTLRILLEKALANDEGQKAFVEEGRKNTRMNNTSTPIVRQSAVDEEVVEQQILKQIEAFTNHWNQLDINLDKNTITKLNTVEVLLSMLQNVVDGIQKKIQTLDDNSFQRGEVRTDQVTPKIAQINGEQSNSRNSGIVDAVESVNAYFTNLNKPDLLETPRTAKAGSTDTAIKVWPSTKAFGKIQRIKTEAKYLLEEINLFFGTREDHQYRQFRKKFEEFSQQLEEVQQSGSDTVMNSARKAKKAIQEAQHKLEQRVQSNERDGGHQPLEEETSATTGQDHLRLTISKTLEQIMDIDAEVQYFLKQIQNFEGTSKDKQYDKISKGLNANLRKLDQIDTPGYDNVKISKQELAQQIQGALAQLNKKLSENQTKSASLQKQRSSEDKNLEIKAIIEKVQQAKAKVERFSGAYRNVLYVQLENELHLYSEQLKALDSKGNTKLEYAKMQVQQKIQRYLRILEEKSVKTEQENPAQIFVYKIIAEPSSQEAASQAKEESSQQGRSAIDNAYEDISSVRNKLIGIKTSMENFSGTYKDPKYDEIEKELIICNKKLSGIEDAGRKSIIYSKNQYTDYIDQLSEYFREKSGVSTTITDSGLKRVELVAKVGENFAAQKNVEIKNIQQQSSYKVLDPLEEMQEIEKNIEALETKIADFSGQKGDQEYEKIDELLIQNLMKLNSIQPGNVAQVREKHKQIMETIHMHARILERKVKSSLPDIWTEFNKMTTEEKLQGIENECENVSKEVNNFSGPKTHKDYIYLEELIVRLMVKLDNVEVGNDAELRICRTDLIKALQENMKVLQERAAIFVASTPTRNQDSKFDRQGTFV